MNRDEQIAAFGLYADLATDGGTATALRDDLERDPDATIAALDAAGLWPDVLWSLVRTLAARMVDATDEGHKWAERWSEQADAGLRDLRARHESMKAAAAAAAKLQHVTGARARGRQRLGAKNRDAILRLKDENKSIAYTAEKLGLHPSTVARHRGEAKKHPPKV